MFTDRTDRITDPTGLFAGVRADVQADLRRVSIWMEQPVLTQTNIMMEASVKAAVHIGKFLTLVGSGGYYGDFEETENRVYYADIRTSKYLTFTVGRFLPAFGILLDDHTAMTRQSLGFGQGQETLNTAVTFENEIFQGTLTRVISAESVEFGKDGPSYEEDADIQNRLVLRSMVKWGQKFATGVSALYDPTNLMGGLFLLGSPIKDYLYTLAEVDWKRSGSEPNTVTTLTWFTRIGSEPIRGVTIGLDLSGQTFEAFETVERTTRVGGFLQVFPTAHVELKLEGRWEGERQMLLLMSHLWL